MAWLTVKLAWLYASIKWKLTTMRERVAWFFFGETNVIRTVGFMTFILYGFIAYVLYHFISKYW